MTYAVAVKLCVLVTQDWELADTNFLRDALVSYYGIPLAAITVTRTYSDCGSSPGRRRLMQLSPPPPSPPPGNGTNSTNSTNSSAVNTTAAPFPPPPPGPVAWARGISLDVVIQTSSNSSASQVQQLFVSAATNSSVAATLTAQLFQNAVPNASIVLSVADVSAVTVQAPPAPSAPPPAPPGRVGGSRLAPLSLLCVLVLVLIVCGPSVRRCVARLRARLPKKTVAFWAECELLLEDDFYASKSWVRGVYSAARRAASQSRPQLPRPMQLRVEAALQCALGKAVGTTSVQLTMCAMVWSDDAGPRMLRICANAHFSALGALGMKEASDRADDFQDSLSEAQTMSGYSHTPLAATVTEAL